MPTVCGNSAIVCGAASEWLQSGRSLNGTTRRKPQHTINPAMINAGRNWRGRRRPSCSGSPSQSRRAPPRTAPPSIESSQQVRSVRCRVPDRQAERRSSSDEDFVTPVSATPSKGTQDTCNVSKHAACLLEELRIVAVAVQGCSSVGRASVSKTEGRGFESLRPCQNSSEGLASSRLQLPESR